MKTCITIIWLLTVTVAFVVGYGRGVTERYDEVEKVVLFEYNQQLKEAIRDGIPFKLKGSEVNIVPRKDGTNNVFAVKLDKGDKEIRQANE